MPFCSSLFFLLTSANLKTLGRNQGNAGEHSFDSNFTHVLWVKLKKPCIFVAGYFLMKDWRTQSRSKLGVMPLFLSWIWKYNSEFAWETSGEEKRAGLLLYQVYLGLLVSVLATLSEIFQVLSDASSDWLVPDHHSVFSNFLTGSLQRHPFSCQGSSPIAFLGFLGVGISAVIWNYFIPDKM